MTSTTFLLRDVEQITVYQLLPDLAVLKNFRWLSSCSGTVSMRGPCEHSLNFSRVFLYWVFPYLTQRQYFVQLDSNYSCFPSANYDFPQVSTIGPILFNLCVDDILSIAPNNTLREKCLYSELLWSVRSCIWTEYEEIFRISPYSVRMRENTDQNNSEYGHFLRSNNFMQCADDSTLHQSCKVTKKDACNKELCAINSPAK